MTFNELLSLDAQSPARKATRKESPKKVRPKSRPIPKPRPRRHDTRPPRNHDTTASRNRETVASDAVQRIRKATRQVGKEAATYRFTQEEKEALADIVYSYGRLGLKTSENEVVRIGVNWLLGDHGALGEKSLLHRVLKALKE